MVQIAIFIVLGLVGLSVLVMLLFGIRSLTYGKLNPVIVAIMASPILLLGVLGLIVETWAEAAIISVLVMLAIAVFALLFTGMKGMFT